jgi:AcrR family transcriptional regulator
MMKSIPHPQDRKRLGSRPSRRERRSLENRERLFRAALRLFGAKGFVETTVEDITEAADLGKGTFFNYFPSKEHILIAFGEMQIARLEEFVAIARESIEPLPALLRTMIARMTEEPVRNPAIVRALIQANLSSPRVRKGMIRIHERNRELLSELIRLGQERGEIRGDLPAGDIALAWRQMIFGTLLFWSLFGDDTLPERIESAIRVLWSGIAARNLPEGKSEEKLGDEREPG